MPRRLSPGIPVDSSGQTEPLTWTNRVRRVLRLLQNYDPYSITYLPGTRRRPQPWYTARAYTPAEFQYRVNNMGGNSWVSLPNSHQHNEMRYAPDPGDEGIRLKYSPATQQYFYTREANWKDWKELEKLPVQARISDLNSREYGDGEKTDLPVKLFLATNWEKLKHWTPDSPLPEGVAEAWNSTPELAAAGRFGNPDDDQDRLARFRLSSQLWKSLNWKDVADTEKGLFRAWSPLARYHLAGLAGPAFYTDMEAAYRGNPIHPEVARKRLTDWQTYLTSQAYPRHGTDILYRAAVPEQVRMDDYRRRLTRPANSAFIFPGTPAQSPLVIPVRGPSVKIPRTSSAFSRMPVSGSSDPEQVSKNRGGSKIPRTSSAFNRMKVTEPVSGTSSIFQMPRTSPVFNAIQVTQSR